MMRTNSDIPPEDAGIGIINCNYLYILSMCHVHVILHI